MSAETSTSAAVSAAETNSLATGASTSSTAAAFSTSFRPSTPYTVYIPGTSPIPMKGEPVSSSVSKIEKVEYNTPAGQGTVKTQDQEITFKSINEEQGKQTIASEREQICEETLVEASENSRREMMTSEMHKQYVSETVQATPLLHGGTMQPLNAAQEFSDLSVKFLQSPLKPPEPCMQEMVSSSQFSSEVKEAAKENIIQYTQSQQQHEFESGVYYESKQPVHTLIKSFEQNTRPSLKYTQVQKTPLAEFLPPKQDFEPEPAPSEKTGNIYYVSNAVVQSRQFADSMPALTQQTFQTGTQVHKVSSFSSFQQHSSMQTFKQETSSTQKTLSSSKSMETVQAQQSFKSNTFPRTQPPKPTSIPCAAGSFQQLLTKPTGKTCFFL